MFGQITPFTCITVVLSILGHNYQFVSSIYVTEQLKKKQEDAMYRHRKQFFVLPAMGF